MRKRELETVRRGDVDIAVAIEGKGPPLVMLPSYGRDGLDDFDCVADLIARRGWTVVRPQPRGIAGSQGPLQGIDLIALASDVATVIETCADGSAIVLGHAFGNFIGRVVSVEH